jgi:tetratricopeptide (TPR) repeat protein
MTDEDTTPAPDDTGPLPTQDREVFDEQVWADTDSAVTEDGVWAEDVDAPVAPTPRDPIVTGMLIFALSLVIALVATTGALYFYLATLNKAPRTLAERDISVSELKVAEEPKSVAAWVELAYAYAKAGRVEDALEAVKRGERTDNAELMAVVKADVLRFSGRLEEAVQQYDRAETATAKLIERYRMERAKKGVTSEEIDQGAFLQVYWGRGLANMQLGRTDAAIADLELAVEENPRQASIWVSLGDLYAEKNDVQKAEESYREALRYAPELPEAVAGLKRIGGGE